MSKNRIPSETPPSNDALPEGLLLADVAGVINFATPPTEQFFGCSPQNLAGKPLAELFALADRPAVQNNLAAALARPGLGVAGVYTLRHTDGVQTRVEAVITCLPEQLGGSTVVVSVRPAAQPAAKDRELQELAELHRITMENILDPVFITDDAGKFTFICANVVHSLGYSSTEMQAKGSITALTGDNIFDPAELQRHGLIRNIERNIIDKAGQTHTFLITVRRVSIQGGTVLHTWREVTERKQAELALRRYMHMVSATPNAVSLVDRDYVYRVVNNAYLRRASKRIDEIVGHPVADVMGTEVFEQIVKPYLDRCFNGEIVRYQAWFDLPSEGRRFLDVTYAPYREHNETISGALVSVRDFTDLKQAEQALRQNEVLFRRTFETIPDPAILWRHQTDGDFTMARVNRAAREWSKGKIDNFLGDSLEEFFKNDRRPADYIRLAFATGQTQQIELQYQLVTTGETRWIVADYARVGDDYVINIVHDVTGRKQKEEQIKAALAEKEVLLRELYHRTKNNMQVIGSLLSLQAAQAKSASVSTVFKEMETRIRAMALVHQKLYQSQNLSSIDLKEYISDLALLLTRSYQLNTDRVSLVLELEPVPVLIDTAIPCGLILHELISNAFKHAFPGTHRGQIRICLNKADDAIALQVSDNGVGLAADFDPRQSQTLGLQTILGIGEHQLQGRVTLKTGPGVTCTIQFKDNLYQARI